MQEKHFLGIDEYGWWVIATLGTILTIGTNVYAIASNVKREKRIEEILSEIKKLQQEG